ncbi:MAG: flap endonuclease-1 [Candidatus Aenigmarchaeota archaeon CG15_BIG_FIL_POST_REV_8_21_14_020_37_27]|nr:MAG: flap endonuclease-1 [Candidatus Aenigmarchaeota archaeon CG15_BIG_FIL_POST_REV_8_21_14_020_37_27]
MGVQISRLAPKTEIDLETLSGKKIAVDAYNILFQFLSIIRQRDTGEPLRDSKGGITSHLSGVFYRNIKLLESGIKPIFVIDGEPPDFKMKVLRERQKIRDKNKIKWEEAVEKGEKEKIMTYAQGALKVTVDMVGEARKLLEAMGIPCIEAPSEGEAQASLLVRKGDAYAVGSQDIDSLLFASPKMVRNLSITGKRKLPHQQMWIEIKPELIELEKMLSELGINQEQLVVLGILVGTDYNPGGIKGIGPKGALKLVKEKQNLENVLKEIDWEFETDPRKIYDFFLNPPVKQDYEIEWNEPNKDEIMKIMVDEHEFSQERIEKGVERLLEIRKSGTQSTLSGWFKK